MNDTTDEKPQSKRQQRQGLEAVKINTTPPTANDLAFIAREFILCTLGVFAQTDEKSHRTPRTLPFDRRS